MGASRVSHFSILLEMFNLKADEGSIVLRLGANMTSTGFRVRIEKTQKGGIIFFYKV